MNRKLKMQIMGERPRARLDLPDVTIWAASWSKDIKMLNRTLDVLEHCDRLIRCRGFVLFHFLPLQRNPYLSVPFDRIPVRELNMQTWNPFVNREVPQHLKHGFAMSVHEDGFPINLSMWDPAFLNYDYIGAPWDDGVVGNGGFNIESEKLMREKLTMPVTPEEANTASDYYVCRNMAPYLQGRGIRFAPRDLALKFSTEMIGNEWPSFGFHGRNWARDKYAFGWQMVMAKVCPR